MIFEMCSTLFSQFRVLLLEALYDAAIKLKRYTFLNITMKIISEMVEVMGDVENIWIKIGWFDRLIGETHKEKERNELV